MRWYHVTLRHRRGRITFSTLATRMTQAVRNVLNSEKVPFSAITKIRRE